MTQARAFEPLGYQGALHRLRSKLFSALMGNPLRIVVLGGSMTAGADCVSQRWSTVLESQIGAHFSNVTVLNYAMSASPSTTVITGLTRVADATPDVILVDYAINDGASDAYITSQDTKDIARLLLNLPSKPAVVYLETLTAPYNCIENISEYLHWPPLKALNIPVVSYSEAACAGKLREDRNAYMERYPSWADVEAQVDKEIWQLSPHAHTAHPNCSTHSKIGHLVADYLSQRSMETCYKGEAFGDEFSGIALKPVTQYRCASLPLTTLYTYTVGDDANGGLWNETLGLLDAPLRFPAASVNNSAWYFGMDRIGKWGWIANPGHLGEIAFHVRTDGNAGSAILVEALGSYANMGSTQCQLDNNSALRWTLNGSVPQVKVSQAKLWRLSTERVQPGKYLLRCRSDGRKFRFISVRSC